MLVTVQFPFADLRPFIAGETNRLLTPVWPAPRVGTDFVRLLGQVRNRRFGGVKDWSGEDVFCNAVHAIRFVPTFATEKWQGKRRRYGAYRRFFADGEGLARIEVGVGFRGSEPWTVPEFLDALHDASSIPVLIGKGKNSVTTKLLSSAKPLARLTLAATTSRKAPSDFKPADWWMAPAEQMLLVEYDAEREAIPLPPAFRVLTHSKLEGVDLAYGRVLFAGRPAAVWLYGGRKDTDRDFHHRLRIHILRLHAQREVVKEVLRAIQSERIDIVKTNPQDSPKHPSNRLQKFLADTIDRMDRKEYSGLPQSELLQAIEEVQDTVEEGERTAILQLISPLRRYVLTAVERFTDVSGSVERVLIINQSGGNVQVGDNNQNLSVVGSNNVINQVVAQHMENAFNTVNQASVPDELKKRLTELNQLVDQFVKKAPPEAQEKAAMNLEMLTKQATAKKPDRAWYDVSASGLIEAAKFVAELAAPITTAVKAVGALLL